MKVNPTQNYYVNYSSFTQKNIRNKNTNSIINHNPQKNLNVFYGKDLINFKSNSAMKKIIAKAPLDDKMAFVYNKIDLNEFVVVGKNITKATEAIKNIGEKIVTPIEKLHFMEHPYMEEVVLLFLNPLGQKMIMNPHSLPIRLNGF